ncbi:erythromycin esterase family protein [Niallia nealsonii]|uniref:erythromycin esterase family protein n=1 Tax=Niallia nealsonii TaxID=115979 RepID=UPI0038B2C31B
MIKASDEIKNIQKYSKTFENAGDLDNLIRDAGKAKYVLLGEATHGTSEFYSIRAEITKKLIEDYGFSFVAVEGDWPSCYEVNKYIKGGSEYSTVREVLKDFHRWPTWMWANEEMIPLLEWLTEYNQNKSSNKAGFYGLDVYSLWESIEAIVSYLKETDSPDLEKALKAIECFEPYNKRAEQYGMSAAFLGESCREEVLHLLQAIISNSNRYKQDDAENFLNLQINGLVSKNAEAYYKAMITDDVHSWNIRDRHMVETLDLIGNFYNKDAKGIIWEHNTHIGDARATSMEKEGLENVGQITREKYGKENIYAIGFGTYSGTVIAADRWGAPHKKMAVPNAQRNTWEEKLHRAGAFNQYIQFTEENRHFFNKTIGHRAIGVVYDPEVEHYGNYVPSKVSERYDAFIHVDETHGVTPIL